MSNPDPKQVKHGTGGSFLIEEIEPQAIFTAEDFSDEQRQIERTTVEFAEKQIFPQIAAIEAKDLEVTRACSERRATWG